MSKEEDNKALVGRWFTEFWDETCKFSVVDELAAPDMLLQYSLHAPRRGREDIKAFMSGFREAFPDLNFWGAADLIAEGDYVVGRWEGGGFERAPLGGNVKEEVEPSVGPRKGTSPKTWFRRGHCRRKGRVNARGFHGLGLRQPNQRASGNIVQSALGGVDCLGNQRNGMTDYGECQRDIEGSGQRLCSCCNRTVG
jgi:hypothetical protein